MLDADKNKILEARKAEVAKLEYFQAFEWVTKEEAAAQGLKYIKSRWEDVRKYDARKASIRSRWVLQDFRGKQNAPPAAGGLLPLRPAMMRPPRSTRAAPIDRHISSQRQPQIHTLHQCQHDYTHRADDAAPCPFSFTSPVARVLRHSGALPRIMPRRRATQRHRIATAFAGRRSELICLLLHRRHSVSTVASS
jgi:hypothetical protein